MNEKLSGPVMRTFLAIAKEWTLSDRQVRDVLGGATPITVAAWAAAAKAHKPLTLPGGVMTRLTMVPQIRQLVPADRQSDWLRARHPALSDRAPLVVIASAPEGLELVRDVAMAWSKVEAR